MGTLTLIVVGVVLLGVMATANIADQGRKKEVAASLRSDEAGTPEDWYDPDVRRRAWARQITPWLLVGLNVLLLCNGFSYLMTASIPSALWEAVEGTFEQPGAAVPTMAQASGAMVVTLLTAVGASVLLFPQVRQAIARAQILSPAFDPDSTMHMLALVYCVYLVGAAGLQFALLGDLEELASAIDQASVVQSLVVQAVLFYAVAAVGVGIPQRRTWREALERLGLVKPAAWHVALGVGAALVMLAFQYLVMVIWLLLAGEEAFAEQTRAAEALSGGFDSLLVAGIVAFLTATSEEVAFRGALQPVLGIGLTSIVFALVHTQYGLTPATVVILALAVVLGMIRNWTNTTTAIVCHFMYNFAGLAMSILARNVTEGLV